MSISQRISFKIPIKNYPACIITTFRYLHMSVGACVDDVSIHIHTPYSVVSWNVKKKYIHKRVAFTSVRLINETHRLGIIVENMQKLKVCLIKIYYFCLEKIVCGTIGNLISTEKTLLNLSPSCCNSARERLESRRFFVSLRDCLENHVLRVFHWDFQYPRKGFGILYRVSKRSGSVFSHAVFLKHIP